MANYVPPKGTKKGKKKKDPNAPKRGIYILLINFNLLITILLIFILFI